ncbi:MerR family transcriptional regulator [Limnohabitans sp. MMS-10A-178]|jgi:DNA-binding transcriptional MerR regulator|uniref:MerR family transcriptional regulator n=1 Tax=Limnohabitans sp. MMS-10A-178 TaxID=1835767 RepID=UPI000D33B8E0|nr:MerR family transcriptional regulator [Limnohabitans sp. MMS-10A-178]PUE14085.1 MerR family transcriptional regulator [Limnohabitans sp. MMS-10A-178]
MENSLPSIPAKRYFTIGEVGELCGVKPHVLRYWEQEFTQLRPIKRRGNRRYYQHHEVLMIRRIRDLLYEQGFTISGARNKMQELAQAQKGLKKDLIENGSLDDELLDDFDEDGTPSEALEKASMAMESAQRASSLQVTSSLPTLRRELMDIRDLLSN